MPPPISTWTPAWLPSRRAAEGPTSCGTPAWVRAESLHLARSNGRLRVGDLRVIYLVDGAADLVIVLKVARRAESTYRRVHP